MTGNEHQPVPRRKHIVCVNSSRELLEMMIMLLEDEGFSASPLVYDADIFESITEQRPDAFIVDLITSNQTAWELIELLSTNPQTRDVPRIVVSTNAQVIEILQSRPQNYRVDAFLAKPFDVQDLISELVRLIGSPLDSG